MKKIILSMMVLAATVSVNAQEAFKHIGAGLEVGTAGAGVNVAIPVVSNHLTVKVGYNFPALSYTYQTSMDISSIDESIGQINSELVKVGASADQIQTRFGNKMDIDVPIKANLASVKAMVEYYPFAKSSFRLVAGAFFGASDFITADAYTDAAFWNSYKSAMQEFGVLNAKYSNVPGYEPVQMPALKANVNGETWGVAEKDGRGHLDAALAVASARPYFGLGFGRSVPEGRVAFTFDLGAWYHGAPSVVSNSKTSYDASAQSFDLGLDKIGNVKFWPVASFGLSVRLF